MSAYKYQAHLAARSTGEQKKKSRHHDNSPPKYMEEPVSQNFHPPVFARAHAQQFIDSQRGDSSTHAPYAAMEPPSYNHFASQGAYRARISERYGIS